jgi:NADH:ubiquinone oxidoreductase subunit
MSGPQSIIRKFLIKQKDDALGRDRVGVDRFGNKYYQYYSYHGLPTKRIVLYKFFGTNQFNQDPHFLGWLRRNQILPPTQEELERLYIEHDAFVQKGIEWDEE